MRRVKTVHVRTSPVYDALEAELQLLVSPRSPRHVRIDIWSSIARYETICITFGSGVTEREERIGDCIPRA